MSTTSDKVNVTALLTKFGNPARNQYVLTYPNGDKTFVSYETRIAEWRGGALVLDVNADGYSQTTSTYLNQFSGMSKPDRRKATHIVRENLNA